MVYFTKFAVSRFFWSKISRQIQPCSGGFLRQEWKKQCKTFYIIIKETEKERKLGTAKKHIKSLSRTKQESPLFNTKRLRSIEWGIITNTKCSSQLFLPRRNSRTLRFFRLSSSRVLPPAALLLSYAPDGTQLSPIPKSDPQEPSDSVPVS